MHGLCTLTKYETSDAQKHFPIVKILVLLTFAHLVFPTLELLLKPSCLLLLDRSGVPPMRQVQFTSKKRNFGRSSQLNVLAVNLMTDWRRFVFLTANIAMTNLICISLVLVWKQ